MTYLLDSDVAIDYLRGRERAMNLVARLLPEGLCISMITYGEVFEGQLAISPDRPEAALSEFCRAVPVLPFRRSTMRQFAHVRRDLRRRGLLLPDADTLIAACALDRDLILVTGNHRHFSRVSDLLLLPARSG